MDLRKLQQIPAIASLSSPRFNANHFYCRRQCALFFGFPASVAHRGDGAGTAIVGIWRANPEVMDLTRDSSDDPLCE
jgi:hypothetical protein